MLCLTGPTCLGQAIPVSFQLHNPLDTPREKEVVVVTRAQYLARTGHIATHLLPQAYDSAGHPIPTQADDLNGDYLWDEIAMLVTLGPKQTERFSINMVSPEKVAVFPHTTRAWLAPYIMTSDSTGEYREVKWARLKFDSTKSIYAQYQMGGPVFENEVQAYVASILNETGLDIYDSKSDSLKGIGPNFLYQPRSVGPLPAVNARVEPKIYKYWMVANGPVRSLGYVFIFNKVHWWIFIEVQHSLINTIGDIKPIPGSPHIDIQLIGF